MPELLPAVMSFEIGPHTDVGHVRRTVEDVAGEMSLAVTLLPNNTPEERTAVDALSRGEGTYTGDPGNLIGDIILTGRDRVPVSLERTIPDDRTWYATAGAFYIEVTNRIF